MVYEYKLNVWNDTINKEEIVEGIVFCDCDKCPEGKAYGYAEAMKKLEDYYEILEVLGINFLTDNCVLELMDDDLENAFVRLKWGWANA